VLFRSL